MGRLAKLAAGVAIAAAIAAALIGSALGVLASAGELTAPPALERCR